MLIKDSAPEVAGLFAARWWAPILRGIECDRFRRARICMSGCDGIRPGTNVGFFLRSWTASFLC